MTVAMITSPIDAIAPPRYALLMIGPVTALSDLATTAIHPPAAIGAAAK